ncbi:GMP synthase [Pseudomonas sp. BAY1663]|nr:GMP synthase [Pseudomonas sp. BAY1663]
MSHPDIHAHRILILDFGSQYTQLIARRVREIGVYCELHPWDMSEEDIRAFAPRGIILAGGPESVHEQGSPRAPQVVFDLGVPLFGICYGMQTMAEQLGGKVQGSDIREFGYARVDLVGKSKLFDGIEDHMDDDGVFGLDVWMSHGDKVTEIPAGFHILASTPSCAIASMGDDTRGYYGVQFHPEVTHTRQAGASCRASPWKSAAARRCGRHPTSSRTPSPRCAPRSAMPTCCSAFPAGWIPRWSPHCCTRPSATS